MTREITKRHEDAGAHINFYLKTKMEGTTYPVSPVTGIVTIGLAGKVFHTGVYSITSPAMLSSASLMLEGSQLCVIWVYGFHNDKKRVVCVCKWITSSGKACRIRLACRKVCNHQSDLFSKTLVTLIRPGTSPEFNNHQDTSFTSSLSHSNRFKAL